jgi:hypothetical protein
VIPLLNVRRIEIFSVSFHSRGWPNKPKICSFSYLSGLSYLYICETYTVSSYISIQYRRDSLSMSSWRSWSMMMVGVHPPLPRRAEDADSAKVVGSRGGRPPHNFISLHFVLTLFFNCLSYPAWLRDHSWKPYAKPTNPFPTNKILSS